MGRVRVVSEDVFIKEILDVIDKTETTAYTRSSLKLLAMNSAVDAVTNRLRSMTADETAIKLNHTLVQNYRRCSDPVVHIVRVELENMSHAIQQFLLHDDDQYFRVEMFTVLFGLLPMVADRTLNAGCTVQDIRQCVSLLMSPMAEGGNWSFPHDILGYLHSSQWKLPVVPETDFRISSVILSVWSVYMWDDSLHNPMRAGYYFPWFHPPFGVLTMTKPEPAVVSVHLDGASVPASIPAPAPRRVPAAKALMHPTAQFCMPISTSPQVTSLVPRCSTILIRPPNDESVNADDKSTQAVVLKSQTMESALSTMVQHLTQLRQSVAESRLALGQFAVVLTKFVQWVHSLFTESQRPTEEQYTFMQKVPYQRSRAKTQLGRQLDEVLSKLSFFLYPCDLNQCSTLKILASGGHGIKANRQKMVEITAVFLNAVDVLQPISHCYQAPAVESELQFSADAVAQCSDLAWSAGITEGQRTIVNRFIRLLTSLNGHRLEMTRWITLARVLEECPEYINVRVMLQTDAKSPPAVRFISTMDLLNGAGTYSKAYRLPSTHPYGVQISAEAVHARTRSWKVLCVGFAVCGERLKHQKCADGDGIRVFLGCMLGTPRMLAHALLHLDVKPASIPLDENQLKHLRLTSIDAQETSKTSRNRILGLRARDSLMLFLQRSRIAAHAQMMASGMNDVPVPSEAFNDYAFSEFQIASMQRTRTVELMTPGSANLVVFFLQSAFHSGQTFKRTMALVADATMNEAFFGAQFATEMCTAELSVADLPPWVYPTLLQTMMVKAHTTDNGVQISDNVMPLTCLSAARALVLMQTRRQEQPVPWKFNDADDLITSKEKIAARENDVHADDTR